MNLFISWSGLLSKEIAELLKDWIKITIQATNPWISSEDIDKGSQWFNKISDQLKTTKIGLICITSDNKNKPWLLFEAGALFKGLNNSKIMTFLVNIKHSDVKDPLAKFNHTLPSKEDVKKMMKTINNELGDQKLDHSVFEKVFEKNWSDFDKSFKQIIEKHNKDIEKVSSAETKRTIDDKIDEILNSLRIVNNQINTLDEEIDFDSFNDIILIALEEFREERAELDIFDSLINDFRNIKASYIKELIDIAQRIHEDDEDIEEKAIEARYESDAADMMYDQMMDK